MAAKKKTRFERAIVAGRRTSNLPNSTPKRVVKAAVKKLFER